MQQPKDLFYLQTELVENKVNMAVAHAIDRVIDQINLLRGDMAAHRKEMADQLSDFKKEMTDQFGNFKKEMTAEFNDFKKEMTGQFNDFKQELTGQFNDFKKEMTCQYEDFKKELTGQFNDFKKEMTDQYNDFKKEMYSQSFSLEKRFIAVETKLGMVNEREKQIYETSREIRNRVIEYGFRLLWALGGSLVTFFILHLFFKQM